MRIHGVDLAIIVVYLIGITAVGIWFSRRQRESSSGYFLAGRSLSWVTIGLALFATNISTVHLTGLASSGYSSGLVMGNFEWMAPLCLVLLGLVFAPFYFETRIATLPEFLEGRYGPASRTFLAFMAVVGALFIHIGVTLYAGAVVLESFVGIDILWSILLVAGLTVVYTVLGGLKAVVVTESIQSVMLLGGALAVTIFGLVRLAEEGTTSLAEMHEATLREELAELRETTADEEIEALTQHFADVEGIQAGSKDAAAAALDARLEAPEPRSERMGMLHGEGGFAWWIILLGYPILGIWYWCADQTIVQRVLGARSLRDAQIGPIFCGFIKVLPVFVMVLPGAIGYLLFRDVIGRDADSTLAVLIEKLLPIGLQGLMIAGLLAALMSTVAGALNSAATLVSIDIVKRLRPQTGDRSLVRIGQATAVVVMVLAIAWSTQGERFGGIFKGINHMISVLAPPITAVFLWGVFWPRGTAQASLTTLVSGFVLGAVAFVLDFEAFGYKIITQDWEIPFLLQAWWLFVLCSLVFVVTSLLTPRPDAERVARYCWSNPMAALVRQPWSGVSDPRLLTVLLLAVMGLLYWTFA